MECNIDQADRRNRIVIGVLILLGVLLGFGKWFFAILAIAMIIEGVIGWCAIPLMMQKFNEKFKETKK